LRSRRREWENLAKTVNRDCDPPLRNSFVPDLTLKATVSTEVPANIVLAAPTRNNSRVIGRNFVFMGLEALITLVGTLLTTVFIARVMGPTRLGYFNLVLWSTSITCAVGSLGIPLATLKYMGEFFGSGKPELARAVFSFNLKAQIAVAFLLAVPGLIAALVIAGPQYHVWAPLLVVSIVPNMAAFVPSQANTAAENAAHNTRGAFVGTTIHVFVVIVSLLLHWDLIGIASGIFLSRCAEFVVKIVPVQRMMAAVPRIPLPPYVRKRMFTFSGLGTALMFLQIVIWDRSDIVFLKLLQPDIRQLAFFSLCFSIADRLTLPAQAFADSLSATQMAEYGRNRNSLYKITSHAFVYLLLGTLPILVGVACVGNAFIRVVYGTQYLPAIPVFAVVALFSIPKATLAPGQTLLYSAEDLGFVLKWACAAGALNILLDLLLIPHYGAVGAAFANGIAQTFAAVTIWVRVFVRYPVRFELPLLSRIAASILAMATAVLVIVAMPLSPVTKLAICVPVGTIVFALMIRRSSILGADDRRRLCTLSSYVPAPARLWYERLVSFLSPNTRLSELA